jgi:hypothetical protein
MGLPFNFSPTPASRCGAHITDDGLSTKVDTCDMWISGRAEELL